MLDSAVPGRISASARTSRAREITAALRELLHRVPGIRAAGEPDRLLSSFINGIKHLPCELDG
jgi:cytochrome P450